MFQKRSRRYPEQTFTDAVYADDLGHLANTPTPADVLQHSLERAAADTALHVNTLNTEYMLYGCTTWTLTKRMDKKLDGNYTRMLQAILNMSWR